MPAIRSATHRPAPDAFRDALAELVQIGLSVARMVGRVAETETEAAAARQAGPDAGVVATSLAEAIEADQASAAAAAAQEAGAARVETVARAFARVSRAVRMTVLLAERVDRGWARPGGGADDRDAMARRHIVRGVTDAIGRQADGQRAERLTEALSERIERLDMLHAIASRPAEEIIHAICRDLGLDPVSMAVRPPVPAAAAHEAAPPPPDG